MGLWSFSWCDEGRRLGMRLECDCTTLQVLLGELSLHCVSEHPLGAVGLCAVIPRSRDPAAAAELPHTHPAGLCPMPHPSLHDLASLPVVPPFRVWISTHQSSFSSPCLDLGLSGDSGKQKTTDVASCLVVFRPRRKGLLLIQPRTSSTHSHHPQELCSPLLSRFS